MMNVTRPSSQKFLAETIGVGVIGASPVNPGWAVTAHIPAIRALPGLALRAVGTSRRETAEAAAEAFGVPPSTTPRRSLRVPTSIWSSSR